MKKNVKNKLTGAEIKTLVRLLKKVKLPAPYPVFIALCKSVPLIAIDLAVMPDDQHVLLTHRKDEFYDGWHIPGSILRYGEKVEDAFKRVARQELNISISNPSFNYYFVYHGKREFGIALLFTAKPKTKIKIGEYFLLSQMPKNFLEVQIPEINYLKNRNS
ncbi:MAG TPA: NUDIX domain-containing protein [Candidatus Paceibacterota bacterium]